MGQLRAIDLHRGHSWLTTPAAAGYERDLYCLEGPDGSVLDGIERKLAAIEGKMATVVRDVALRRQLPDRTDPMGLLLEFVALSWARVPKNFERMSAPIRRTGEIIGEVIVSTPEAFASAWRQAGQPGSPTPADYKAMREAVASGSIDVEPDKDELIELMISITSTVYDCLRHRHWVLLEASAGSAFLLSDSPVALHPSDPATSRLRYLGFGVRGTDVTLALTPSLALLGRLEECSGAWPIDRLTVAALNTRTIRSGQRFVYCRPGDLEWLTADGSIGGLDDLLAFRHPDRDRDAT